MFDFDVITGPTSSRPLAPAAKSPQGRSERLPEKPPGEHTGTPPARAETLPRPG
jgi:hypothetical protein